jgi:hypothetical protein
MFINFLIYHAAYEIVWKNIVEPDKPQMTTWRMRIAFPIPKGAHTRTSLASESGWARIPVSQTRPCVECHEPDFGGLYVYISEPGSRVKLPEADSQARLVPVRILRLLTHTQNNTDLFQLQQ